MLFSGLIKADRLLDETPSPAAAAPPTGLTMLTATSTTTSKLVRLHKLQMKHLNGDLTKWTGFW